ncbi:acyl carrier protein [Desulfolithobacter sp.]
MSSTNRENVEKSLIEIIEDLVQDWGLDLADGISGRTSLVEDLDFASVDIIQLCVAIEQFYGKKIGFQSLLMEDGSYVSDLTVNQIADYVAQRV